MYASIQVSHLFYRTVSFKLISFGSQIFLFVREMSTNFTSYYFVLSTLLSFGSCNHCPS